MNDTLQPASLLRERRLAFGLLLASVMGLGMGQTVTFAVLPPLGRQLGLSEFQVGSVFSVSALMWVLLSPAWGRLSDRWGRKPVILAGMSGYIVSTAAFTSAIAFGLAGGVSLLLIYLLLVTTRSIYGAVGPGLRVAAQAYIVDRTSLKDRTVAIAGLSAAFGLGNVIGPGLAAFSGLGLLTPLWFIVGFMLCLAVAVMIWLPEKSAPGQQRDQSRLPVTDPRLRPFLIYGLVAGLAIATPMQVSAFYFIDVLGFDINESAQFVGVGLTASALAALFSQLVLVQRFRLSARTMMLGGGVILAVAQVALALSNSFAPYVFALMLNGLGAGMAIPGYNAGASLSVGSHEQGAVAGIAGAMAAAGFMLVPFINLNLYQINPHYPFLLDVILMVLLLSFCLNNTRIRQAGAQSDALDESFEEHFSE
ncbi:MAG: MFS transporter [Pseudomonadota bacterium]